MTFIKQYISIFLLNVSHTLAVQLFYNCKGLNICANFCTFEIDAPHIVHARTGYWFMNR